jgi:hypothetical protein
VPSTQHAAPNCTDQPIPRSSLTPEPLNEQSGRSEAQAV